MSPRTADFIAEQQSTKTGSDQAPKQPRKNPAAHLGQWKWRKGQSGNPGGRPKSDFAADFARKVMEAQGNEDLLSKYAEGFAQQLVKGNAYTFKELAERGYGKLKEVHQVTHVHEDVPDTDLQGRIDSLIRDIGLARAVDEAGRTQVSDGGAGKTNGKAKDTAVLS